MTKLSIKDVELKGRPFLYAWISTCRSHLMAPDCIGAGVAAMKPSPGEILLLENLRFHPEEEANDPEFSRRLASLADVYVNDAFGSAHRAHASTVGIVSYVPVAAAGLLWRRRSGGSAGS
ncbi:MAG TPA: phosphoglycerate kinase [Bryobacteraceae bacterium]|nr:phosphoglycerate kinase [Bryobacteraceae bacterium]